MPVAPGWGPSEPEPCREVSLSPREFCSLHVATQTGSFPGLLPQPCPVPPPHAPGSFWGSHSVVLIGLLQAPGKGNPSSSSQDPMAGTRAGADRPGLRLGVGMRRLTSLLVVGRLAGPHRRAQMQEVHLRQPLCSCRRQEADPSSAPDLDKARSETDPRWESPGMSAEPLPGRLTVGSVARTAGVPGLGWPD